jgi:heptosyltransferase-2
MDDHLEIWTTSGEETKVVRVLAEAGIGASERIVAIHPFSAVVERGWPLENFAELAVGLAEKGYRPVILGGPGDKNRFQSVSHLFPKRGVDLVGSLTIRETAAFLKKAALFIGNDSGIMHVAAATGVPLAAIFGPQSPLKFGPWSSKARVIYKNFPCSPCRQKFFTECKPSERMRPACVEKITVSEVFKECMDLFQRFGGQP